MVKLHLERRQILINPFLLPIDVQFEALDIPFLIFEYIPKPAGIHVNILDHLLHALIYHCIGVIVIVGAQVRDCVAEV